MWTEMSQGNFAEESGPGTHLSNIKSILVYPKLDLKLGQVMNVSKLDWPSKNHTETCFFYSCFW